MFLGLAVIIGAPLAFGAYIAAGEVGLRLLRLRRHASRVRPWFWMLPPLVLMASILGYPLIDSIRLSFYGPTGTKGVGFSNFAWVFASNGALPTLRNTLIWIILLPFVTVVLGVIFAVLADRVLYERVVKSIVIIPTAMSAVAAVAVWQIVYASQPAGTKQSGILDALWVGLFGAKPKSWLVDGATNNYALVAIGIWMYLGFAVLVLSAGVKGVPTELVESARMDGANGWQVFWYVTLPGIWPAVGVVSITTLAWALKIFDVVYVATGGRFGTDVIGTQVYEELFTYFDTGKGSALAVMLFVCVLPVMVLSARGMRRRGSVR